MAYANEGAGVEITPADQFNELQREHKKLTMTHAELRQRAMQLMQHECQRLLQEIEQLQSTIHRLQSSGPATAPGVRDWAAKEAY